MPYAANGHDGVRVYFEDQGGDGAPVMLHDGFADSVRDLREWALAHALAREGYRVILADHRGHGRSDKPHDSAAYTMALRVTDAVAILDRLGIERAHFVGRSWGGRLCFGIGEHAPGRVQSLVIGGNQPYAWPESAISRALGQALASARDQASMEPLVRAFEALWDIEFGSPQRERLLDNDPFALHAAFTAAMAEGAISADLRRWRVPCLIFIGAADWDFLGGARRAVEEIPDAELLVLQAADHYAAHVSQDEVLIEAALRTLRRGA
jgi:pimeloyl-ACP methyl ester carboxylesterase